MCCVNIKYFKLGRGFQVPSMPCVRLPLQSNYLNIVFFSKEKHFLVSFIFEMYKSLVVQKSIALYVCLQFEI